LRRLPGSLLVVVGAALLVACVQAGPSASAPAESAAASSPNGSSASIGSPVAIASSSVAASFSLPPAESPSSPSGPPGIGVARWTLRPASGPAPAPREDHTWTLDDERGTGYLFGGRDGSTVFDDLWAYDVAAESWQRLEPAGEQPPARFGHTATWVDGIGLVVWAGQAGSAFFDDLWAFDPAAVTWRRLPGDGDLPSARYGSCGDLGPDGRLWISHGFTGEGGRFSDTRAYDFSAGRWTDESPARERPVERCLHDCLWSADGRFLLYAGQTTGIAALGDLWMFLPGGGETPSAWTELPNPGPPARQLYALTDLADSAVVFGGAGVDRAPLDDLWRFSFGELAFEQVSVESEGPDARWGATLIAPAEGRLLLFGGRDAEQAFGDLWTLELDG
jgi:galactose oxidase-like protein